MVACWSCDELVDDDAAFCASCGASLSRGPLLLGATRRPPIGGTEEVVIQRPHRWVPLACALALLFAVPAVWGLSQDGAASEASRGREATDRVDEVPQPATTTTRAVTSARVTSTLATIQRLASAPSPMLGRETGLRLFIGSLRGLREIDLDAGVMIQHDTRLHPALVAEDHLVMLNPNSGGIYAAPLQDLESWSSLSIGGWGTIQSADEGHVWIRRNGSDGAGDSFEKVEVATGGVSRVVDVSFADPLFGVTGSSPELLSPNTGGVYRLTDQGRYERASEGALVVHGSGLALLEQCDQQLNCLYQWVDANDFQHLDRPSPAPGSLRAARLAGGGRWLLYLDDSLQARLFETSTGRVIGDLGTDLATVAVSPQGDFAAVFEATVLVLIDLDSGERVGVPAVHASEYGTAAVFAQSGDAAAPQSEPADR